MAWIRKPVQPVQQVTAQPPVQAVAHQQVTQEIEPEFEEEIQVPMIQRKPAKPMTKKTELIVVKELPTQAVRKVELEDGTEAELITMEEAIGRILKKLEA